MVDLLGRAGRLEEAEQFISKIPTKPSAMVWETLRNAYKSHENKEIEKWAAEKISELEPNGSYEPHSSHYYVWPFLAVILLTIAVM